MATHLAQLVRTSALVAASVVSIAATNVPHAEAAPVFAQGYVTKQAPLGVQPQWQRLLSTTALKPENAIALWQDLHDDARDKHPLRQLDTVNSYFNHIRYGQDTAIYGARDYWATPAEFIERGFGDCEDYSIAKYTALRALGWSADSLLIVVIRDLKNAVNHAALAAKFEGQWYVLDNRSPRVLTPSEVPFYQPVYAVNETQLLVFERTWTTQQAAIRAKRNRMGKANSG
jgi:predicted transglutaminase-like cysteine proteinase